ncbi:MAG: hypothetical protein ABIK89_13050, partial [Planctomycetota bacterium]
FSRSSQHSFVTGVCLSEDRRVSVSFRPFSDAAGGVVNRRPGIFSGVGRLSLLDVALFRGRMERQRQETAGRHHQWQQSEAPACCDGSPSA